MKPVPEDTILWMFHKELHNLDEVYAARQLIESAVYVSASQHMEAVTLDQLELLIQKFVENYDRNSPEELLEQLDRIDLYVGELCGNRIYNKLMQTIVHLRRETNLKLLRVPGSAKNGASGRLQVLTALRSGKSDETKLAMEAFFASSFKFYQSIGS
jgi:GntR family transcriptional regulator, transcriptional repressor for pyruvate dehydrogenase complex